MRVLVEKLIVVICVLVILNQPLFFSFMGLLGVQYEGSESSAVFVLYIVFIAGVALLAYLYGIAVAGILKREALILAAVLVLFVSHMLWLLFDPIRTALLPELLVFFLLFGFPGFLAAATLMKLHLIPAMIRASELFFLIMALGIVLFSVLPSLAGSKTANLAGASYQTLSYYAAFTFGMLLIYNMYMPHSLRTYIATSYWYRGISYGLMLGCLLGCFLGGGRGAFLLLIAYLLVVVASTILNKNNLFTQRGVVSLLLKCLSLAFVLSIFFIYFWDHDFVQTGFGRATQFISDDGGIDLERGSSGRDTVYRDALTYISESPLIGYGPFAFRDKTIHAHNAFLDVWLQFGVIGFIVFLLLMGALAVNAVKNRGPYNFWAFGLLLYPMIMTMFSGTYISLSIFWFGITFMAIYKKPSPIFTCAR